MNYLDDEEDRRVVVAGVRMIRRLAAAPSLSPLIASEYRPGPQVRTDDEILDYVRETASTGFHPVGTCRMGSDNRAVVDTHLRLRGLAGLRVIDASVMPTIVSANTNATTIMIAEKAADMILEDARAA